MTSRTRSSSTRRSAGLGIVGLLALACAGELTGNEEDYFATRAPLPGSGGSGSGSGGSSATGGGGGGGTAGGSGGAPAAGCDRITAIIDKNCKACHNAENVYGGLDLISPGVESRLVDVPGTEADCASLKRIDSANPANSFLLDKLENQKPACGEQMPYGTALSAEDIECVRAWVNQLAGGGS